MKAGSLGVQEVLVFWSAGQTHIKWKGLSISLLQSVQVGSLDLLILGWKIAASLFRAAQWSRSLSLKLLSLVRDMSPLKQETMEVSVGLALHLEGAITTSATEGMWDRSIW